MMVDDVRAGSPMRVVARKFKVSLSTVQRWVERAGDSRLDEVDWNSRRSGSRQSPQRTLRGVERQVLRLRKELKTRSALGEYGAGAIRRELERRGGARIPSVRTIGRILSRNGALDGRRRIRHSAPPPGWYLLPVAQRKLELDSFDMIEDLVIRGGQDVNVLTGISLHGGLCMAWPHAQITAKITVECLLDHWSEWGLPGYAKFDNGTVFQGTHRWPNSFGRVTRVCLSLGVTPVFAPPLSRGFQADIEAFNGRWQDAVWDRFTFKDLEALQHQSARFVVAHHDRHAVRIEDAPPRRPFPKRWRMNLQRPLAGTVIFIRSTDASGDVSLLGHSFHVSDLWCHRLVRAEVDLDVHQIRFFRLRRREPANHILLATHRYEPPSKPFHE